MSVSGLTDLIHSDKLFERTFGKYSWSHTEEQKKNARITTKINEIVAEIRDGWLSRAIVEKRHFPNVYEENSLSLENLTRWKILKSEIELLEDSVGEMQASLTTGDLIQAEKLCDELTSLYPNNAETYIYGKLIKNAEKLRKMAVEAYLKHDFFNADSAIKAYLKICPEDSFYKGKDLLS